MTNLIIRKQSRYPKDRPEPLELYLDENNKEQEVEVFVQTGDDRDPDRRSAFINLDREEVTKVVMWLVDWLDQPRKEVKG